MPLGNGGSATSDNGKVNERAQVSAVAWVAREELDRKDWESAGRKLGAIGRGTQWWIGDWLRYGNARWGEKYTKAAEITGYDVGSLRNMAWVSSQFDLSLRSGELSWSHHAILAPFEEKQKREWLQRAKEERLSVSGLRSELRSTDANGRHQEPGAPADASTDPSAIKCPNCGHEIAKAMSEE